MKRHQTNSMARVTILDVLLIRALVNCAAGLNYENEIDEARLLAVAANP